MSGPAVAQNGETLSFPVITEVLGLSLHYGLFEKDVPITPSLDTLRNGQKRFLDEVIHLIPVETQTLLDVGTGNGDIAEEIAAKGIQVTTISPDPNQACWVESRLNANLHFKLSKFENFIAEQAFDCILFSESSNYVSLQQLFSHSSANLTNNGTLIVAAPFLIHPSENFPDMHLLDDFYHKAKKQGWVIEEAKDYTEETAPTLWLGQQMLENHVSPSVNLVKKYLNIHAPWYIRLLGKVMRFEIRKLDKMLTQSLPQRLNPENFRQDVRFMFFRLRPKM